MKNGYELPGDRATMPSWVKTALFGGIPTLLLVIILCAAGNCGGNTEPPPEGTPAPESTHTRPAPAAAPGQPPAQPRQQPAQVKPKAPATYSFDGAAQGDLALPNAKSCLTGILVDADNHRVLWAKDARKAVPIASMTKMMTLLLAFEDMETRPEITLSTPVAVTPEANKIGGSQVYLDPRETFPFGELLKSVAIKSANDSAYLVAEFLNNGDVAGFTARMNTRAAELGMTSTAFLNSHGLAKELPNGVKKDSLSSALDMVILGEQLLHYPQLMTWASTPMDSFRDGKTELKNHNNLVFKKVNGVDGLKTGFINSSGFCVTVSCLRGGKRTLACVTGFKTYKERDAFAEALLNWGYTRLAEPQRK